jgi:hypothetical protein
MECSLAVGDKLALLDQLRSAMDLARKVRRNLHLLGFIFYYILPRFSGRTTSGPEKVASQFVLRTPSHPAVACGNWATSDIQQKSIAPSDSRDSREFQGFPGFQGVQGMAEESSLVLAMCLATEIRKAVTSV